MNSCFENECCCFVFTFDIYSILFSKFYVLCVFEKVHVCKLMQLDLGSDKEMC